MIAERRESENEEDGDPCLSPVRVQGLERGLFHETEQGQRPWVVADAEAPASGRAAAQVSATFRRVTPQVNDQVAPFDLWSSRQPAGEGGGGETGRPRGCGGEAAERAEGAA